MLLACSILAVGVAIRGDKFELPLFGDNVVTFWAVLWLAWAIVFYLCFRNASTIVTRALAWLLKGSVLELLVVVPCHVIVRRRHDCSAPSATSIGIVTGLAVTLLSFGPGVLLLYKKRLDSYPARSRAAGAS